MRTFLATSRSATPLFAGLNSRLVLDATSDDVSLISAARDLPSLLKFALLFGPQAVRQYMALSWPEWTR